MRRFAFIILILTFCLRISAQEKPYAVKSGAITTEMNMMGQSMVQVTYFDDYGAKQASISEFNGQQVRVLVQKGSSILINDKDKTAVRMPGMGNDALNGINFSNLDEKMIRKHKIKEVGEEEIAGRTCIKYSLKVLAMGQAVNVNAWIYKGIPFKTSIRTEFGELGSTVTDFSEDIEVDPALFTIPEGVTVQEINMGGMQGGPGF